LEPEPPPVPPMPTPEGEDTVSDPISEYFAERPQVLKGSDAGADQFEAAVAERHAATLARDFTRLAIRRHHEAQRITAAADRISRQCRAADTWSMLAATMAVDAEELLINAILAHAPDADDFHPDRAHTRACEPRGVVDGDTLYLAVQNPSDPKPVGHQEDGDQWVMFLAEVPLVNLHTLGGPAR
jgi:hypothetical protein